jgi:hypothetical protein
MFCLIFLLGHIVLVTELMARPSTDDEDMYNVVQMFQYTWKDKKFPVIRE